MGSRARDGERVATMTYSRGGASLVIIDHTEVQATLGGQAFGNRLLSHVVDWARATNTKLLATCPVATKQFQREPARFRDELA